MESLEHEVTINCTPSAAFEAVTTQAGLRAWHTADATGSGPNSGVWNLGKDSRAPFTWEVTESTPDLSVVWRCLQGPGSSPGTQVHFVIDVQPDGRTKVTVIHSGWSSRDGNYRKCNTLWGALLHHLQQYLETGQPSPMFA